MTLKQMLANLLDELYAPPGALEPTTAQTMQNVHMASEIGPEWHNNFGTLPDFSSPVEFDSMTSFGMGCDSSFGCSWD